MSPVLQSGRPQPVRVMAVVLAVLGFLTGAAGLADLIPKVAIAWLVIIYGVVQVAWGAWTASQVTPLAAPQNNAGVPLVPLNTQPPLIPSPRDELGAVDVWTLVGILAAVILAIILLSLLL